MTEGGSRTRLISSLRNGTVTGLRVASRLKDGVRKPAPGAAVMIYHRVGGRTPTVVDLPEAQFRSQMELIAHRASTLDHTLAWLDGGPAGDGPPPVVVTFDDGTIDVVDEALPICVELGIPLLLYVATQFVDEQIELFDEGRPATWAQLADGLSTGFLHIGSHTHSHALLDRLPASDVEAELDRSIGLIQDNLGVDPVHFAYPRALPGNAAADAAVRKRFASAVIGRARANVPGSTDPWLMTRSPVQTIDSLADFERKVAGGLSFEDDVKEIMNKVRFRGLRA